MCLKFGFPVWTLHPAAPTYGLCSHIPGLWGVTLDRKTRGLPCNSLSVIYQSPKPLLPTFSVRLHSVRMHPTRNIRSEGLVVQIPRFMEEEIAGELSTGPVGIPEQGYPWAASLHSQSCKEGRPCSHNIHLSWFLSRLQAMNDWRFWLQAARSGHRMSQPYPNTHPPPNRGVYNWLRTAQVHGHQTYRTGSRRPPRGTATTPHWYHHVFLASSQSRTQLAQTARL